MQTCQRRQSNKIVGNTLEASINLLLEMRFESEFLTPKKLDAFSLFDRRRENPDQILACCLTSMSGEKSCNRGVEIVSTFTPPVKTSSAQWCELNQVRVHQCIVHDTWIQENYMK